MTIQALDPTAELESFFSRLSQARECALLLDYDGTLAPFHIQRDQAHPYPGVRAVLSVIALLGDTRLGIVSGRPANEVPPLLGLGRHQPEVWGCHGWERLKPDGSYQRMTAHPQTLEGLASAYDSLLALACGSLRSVLRLDEHIERKPMGLALHWRGCSPSVIKEVHDSVTRAWVKIARETGLKLCEFEEGLELRASECTKADAVEAIIEETSEDAAVAYLGDGLTDEDAFRSLKGKGLTVLVRPKLRATAADFWIRTLEELLHFLWLWADLRSRPRLNP